jgi:tetratricopeptide (TPR) repeat protein
MAMTPPRTIDSADRMQFLQAYAWLLFGLGSMLVFVEVMFFNPGSLIGWALLLALDGVLLALLAWLINAIGGWTGRTLIGAALAGGNLPAAPAHSGMESLVARGFYREAAEAYTRWLVERPEDHLARLKLGDVHREHLGDPATAEQLYQEVRRAAAARDLELSASNRLIELYRAQGRHDRVLVELARLAERFRGTVVGTRAAEALRELKRQQGGAAGA